MAGYPQVVSPPPGTVRGYPAMQPQMQNYPVGYAPQPAPAYAPVSGYVNPGLQVRSPQGFATPPTRHSPMPTGAVEQKGTLRPGQEIRVGKQVVIVDKYLSEGGYAHVYLTHSRQPIGPNRLTSHCLKRIAFRDDQGTDMLKETEKEIQVMKALTGNDRIVEYLDSEMKRLESRREGGPGWEVFILMEFCAGGGILDLLNKRLRDRLREDEILSIFVDVCEAVAHMHSLWQPLLHRDLKIENILCTPLTPSGSSSSSSISSFRYKVCDFGSTTYPANQAPRSKREAEALAYDLNRHTTLQYRSPEMVEPLLGLPVGLPADVWALGVLLYKLCYYTTPFEEHGPLAIVNAKYTFPPYPVYSPVLQHLIASMLVEQSTRRPTVFDILAKVHQLRGTQSSRDYTHLQMHSRSQQVVSPAPKAPANGSNPLDFRSSDDLLGSVDAIPDAQAQLVASIQPQRRGRPTKGAPTSVEQPMTSNKPTSRTQIPSVQVQVTGENGSLQTSAHPKNDLVRDIKRFAADFGDAFTPEAANLGPPSTGQTVQSGFDDGFDGTRLASASPEPLVKARTASPIPSTPADTKGFGDAFAPSSKPHERPSSSRTINIPVPKDAERSAPLLSQTADNGENSTFEDRFPSVEQLAARAEMDSVPAITKSPEHMQQPLRPSFGRQSSSQSNARMMSFHQPSVTGGANNDSHQTRLLSFDEHPPARSTQVTGTAFNEITPISSSKTKQPSFDLLGSLSTDIDPPSGSNSATAGFGGVASSGPEESRPLFERLGSSRSNADVPRAAQDTENTSRTSSKLERSRTPVDLLTGGNNASFDDYGYSALLPPNNVGKKNPPPVNTKPSRFGTGQSIASSPTTMGGMRDLPVTDSANPTPVQSAAPKTAIPRPLPSKPDHLRQTGSSSPRPQSMHLPPSSFSPVSPSRVPASADIRSKEGYPSRPAPVSRRSSINEMVARYESLASPKLEKDEFDSSSRSRSRGQTVPKPAPKPVQLKAGMSTEQAEGASGLNRSRSMFLPSSSSRPGTRRESTERTMDNAGLQPGSARPLPSTRRSSNQSAHSITEEQGDTSAGNQGKSVNALIARWNQGAPPAQGTHPSVSRNRAPLGSGRRL